MLEIDETEREELIELISEHLFDTITCTRVWSAWSYNTMTENDFKSVSDSEIPTELADEIIKFLKEKKL